MNLISTNVLLQWLGLVLCVGAGGGFIAGRFYERLPARQRRLHPLTEKTHQHDWAYLSDDLGKYRVCAVLECSARQRPRQT